MTDETSDPILDHDPEIVAAIVAAVVVDHVGHHRDREAAIAKAVAALNGVGAALAGDAPSRRSAIRDATVALAGLGWAAARLAEVLALLDATEDEIAPVRDLATAALTAEVLDRLAARATVNEPFLIALTQHRGEAR